MEISRIAPIRIEHWGRDAAVEPNVVETCVLYLRAKLVDRGPRPLIRTIRRVGYTARTD